MSEKEEFGRDILRMKSMIEQDEATARDWFLSVSKDDLDSLADTIHGMQECCDANTVIAGNLANLQIQRLITEYLPQRTKGFE